MPAFPEIADIFRLKGSGKIDRYLNPQHHRDAKRHIRISGEIEIQLESIGDQHGKRRKQIQIGGGRKSEIHGRCKVIGQQHFFGKSEGEEHKSSGDIRLHPPAFIPV